jgi:hypothetical protein
MLAISCGGSGSSLGSSTTPPPSGSNVATAVVDAGPSNNSINTLFVSVTVCMPGSTTTCQVIDNVEVDTGSYGLRILSSVLTLNLPVETLANNATLAECTNFVQGYSWGPVALANVQIAGETADSIPVQIIGDANYSTVPRDCSGTGTAIDTVAAFGANAVLGVGPFVQDCGAGCADAAVTGAYYSCSTPSTCAATAVAVSGQVSNPVSAFTTDNNGIIIQLPAVPAAGSANVSGYLIFGIDTESNNASNASGTETVLTVDDLDDLTVTFNGQTLSQSFIDSGTNGIYFNDTSLPVCTQAGLTDFYCPSATEAFSATLTGNNGMTASAQFSVANTYSLLSANPSFTAFADIGGTYPGASSTFDLGLPFYYGRRVATAIEGNTTTVGTGPYFAF